MGSAKGYEITGNLTMKAVSQNFFDILTAGEGRHWDPSAPGGHSFATGGSNAAEHWFAADSLGDSLLVDSPIRGYPHAGSHTQESCTTYNALKVSRHIYGWSADPKMADYFERTFLNSILGNQNLPAIATPAAVLPDAPESVGLGEGETQAADPPHTVELEYMLPLGGAGLTKPWGLAGPSGPSEAIASWSLLASVLGSWVKPCGTRLGIRKGGKGRRTPTQDPSTHNQCAAVSAARTLNATGQSRVTLSLR